MKKKKCFFFQKCFERFPHRQEAICCKLGSDNRKRLYRALHGRGFEAKIGSFHFGTETVKMEIKTIKTIIQTIVNFNSHMKAVIFNNFGNSLRNRNVRKT